MARDEGTGSGAVVTAFLLGAVAGAAFALLWAPASGDETRRFLNDKAREGRDRANEAARQGREFLNRQRETVFAAVERGRDAYNQARQGPHPVGASEKEPQ
jgi:gas vesicle protein